MIWIPFITIYLIIGFFVARFLAFYINERNVKRTPAHRKTRSWTSDPGPWSLVVLTPFVWLPVALGFFPYLGIAKLVKAADGRLIYAAKEILDPKNNVKEIS